MQLLPSTTNLQTSAEMCAAELLDALPPMMRVVRKHMRSQRARGLSVPQFRAMAFLGSTAPATLSMVAEFLGASMPTTSRIVTGLVSKGLIKRCERQCDRRCVELALTARGKSVVETATRAARALLAKELEPLSEVERNALLMAMKSLRALFAPAMRIAKGNDEG